MTYTHKCASVLALCCSLGMAGCVSKKIEPAYIPKVMITQNYKGEVTISWPSRTGYNYRLAVRDDQKVVFDEKVYKGTGETITVQIPRDPGKPLPDYFVKPEKIMGN